MGSGWPVLFISIQEIPATQTRDCYPSCWIVGCKTLGGAGNGFSGAIGSALIRRSDCGWDMLSKYAIPPRGGSGGIGTVNHTERITYCCEI